MPYLQTLGIGAAYTSPYFAAQPGSTHGYDVSNHNELNVEVGGSEAHTVFTDALREHGLQHIVDFVPNHMGIATSTNPWWRDVLENGPSARAGRFFDIDWFPAKRELRRKLLLPILGDQYGRVLERGELRLELAPHGVSSLSLWQGLTFTERAERELARHPESTRRTATDPAVGCSTEFPGRVIAALAGDPDIIKMSGGTFIAAEVAEAYGITDVDGAPSHRCERNVARRSGVRFAEVAREA